ncbi:site-2 protease family protein [Brevibacillus dissolubilis]|uniref:site-2 protease family protein n=1 Tax=Brevibacillus dissolubilis TaxID=1844116 RepID=UPI0011164402|nr:site-2 protease family protein [Brevibacillus dissolubilis]
MKQLRSILIAIGLFLLTKLKWVIGILKFSKFGVTLLTMLISVWAYAVFYGWKFAVALVYLIFVHEIGHVIAGRIKGLKQTAPTFIPFLGAFVGLKELPKDASTMAFYAYGGPLAGLISFLPAIALYQSTGDPFWALVIYLGAFINLLNLLPVSPLDGGRIVSVLSPNIWFFGLLLLGIFLFFTPDPFMFLIFFLGLFSWWSHLQEGYKLRVLTYEKEGWESLIAEMKGWLTEPVTGDRRYDIQRAASQASHYEEQRGFLIPLIHEEKKFARDKARMDRDFALIRWNILSQYERMPVDYSSGVADYSQGNAFLMDVISETTAKHTEIKNDADRLSTYYQSSKATKWKVLIAYIALIVVLSVCAVYGINLMELHRGQLGS